MKRADKLFNFRPVFFAAVFVCVGIVCAYLSMEYQDALIWFLSALALSFVALLCFSRDREELCRRIVVGILLLFCFSLGYGRFSLQTQAFDDQPVYSGDYAVAGTVENVRGGDEWIRVSLRDVRIDGGKVDYKLDAYLPTSFYDEIRLCDEVFLTGRLETRELFEDGKFNSHYVAEEIRYTIFAKNCEITGSSFDLFLFLRARIQTAVEAGMSDSAAAVTMAVLTGDTSTMDESLLENVRQGGIAHIFAVSGLHIGSLYAFCFKLLQKTRLKKLPGGVKFGLIALVLIMYGGICGFSDSVVRAIVMCLAFYASKCIGLKGDMLESIGLAAFILLAYSPASLLLVGFQLSFAACLGIALLSPPMQRALEVKPAVTDDGDTLPLNLKQRILRSAISFLSVTLAAQIATAPILYKAYDYLSGWSLLLNCIFIPMLSAVFSALLLFVFVASLLSSAVAAIVLYVPSVLWETVLLVFETMDFSTLSLRGLRLPTVLIIDYYAAVVFASDKWNVSKKQRLALLSITVTVFVGTMVALNV